MEKGKDGYWIGSFCLLFLDFFLVKNICKYLLPQTELWLLFQRVPLLIFVHFHVPQSTTFWTFPPFLTSETMGGHLSLSDMILFLCFYVVIICLLLSLYKNKSSVRARTLVCLTSVSTFVMCWWYLIYICGWRDEKVKGEERVLLCLEFILCSSASAISLICCQPTPSSVVSDPF